MLPASAGAASECDKEGEFYRDLCRSERPLVSIQMSAASPRAGSIVKLTASSDGRRVTYAWDLDGDGTFDDAVGVKAEQIYTSGTRTVGVRATDAFGRTSAETRTFLVHDFNARPTVELDLGSGVATVGQSQTIRVTAADPDGPAPRVDVDRDGNGSFETLLIPNRSTIETTALTAGAVVIAARATDEAGATTVATAPLQAFVPTPGLGVRVTANDPNRPVVAGELVDVQAVVTDLDAVKYEFDYDGDGTFEDDRRLGWRIAKAFTVGEHEVGVRVTDRSGVKRTARTSFLAVASADSATPSLRLEQVPRAYTGVPIDLRAKAFTAGEGFRVDWDADGDGAFDDTFTSAGTITDARGTFTYTAPGTYDVRAKVTNASGVSRVDHTAITVTDSPAAGPGFGALTLSPPRPAGQEWILDARSQPGSTLTFDLDGDGQFDDVPAHDQYGYRWAFATPVAIAVKATDAAGRSTVRTQEVEPLPGNVGPQANLMFLPQVFPTPEQIGEPRLLAGRPTTVLYELLHVGEPCCTATWDTDGDGDYDDATGAFGAFTPQAREYTLGLRVEDDLGGVGTVRDTFSVGTLPPKVAVDIAPNLKTATATASDPDGALSGPLEWDLDNDGVFDDATGDTVPLSPTAYLVGVRAADAGGDIGIDYAQVQHAVCTCEPPEATPTPTPTPDPTSGPIENPPPPKPLRLNARFATPRLGALLARGLTVRPGCEIRCRATVAIEVDKRTAKKLKLRSTELGHAGGTGTTITVKLNAKARKALAKVRSVRFRVAVVATGADGRIGTANRTLTVKR
ncbi:hypothetical protein [Solirubrobacter ginsenosidimutans]|uniref:hypothetical protein n=1 Tax=Solirubrobacter ginsenosidimutans TaxID=490573 RepID=UPI0022CDEC88|nr:hypothetical protein [Solirubrobacter ginsenosidimutans]